MEQWKDWAKVSAGPYQGKPELTMAEIGESGYVIYVRDRAVWEESLSGNGEGLISCVVLRKNGELWLRERQFTRDDYSEREDSV